MLEEHPHINEEHACLVEDSEGGNAFGLQGKCELQLLLSCQVHLSRHCVHANICPGSVGAKVRAGLLRS